MSSSKVLVYIDQLLKLDARNDKDIRIVPPWQLSKLGQWCRHQLHL